jgi:hypothetical protein
MKLKSDEEILKEYYFSKDKNSFNKSILTNRRIVFITNNSEENYPLSKVTSVKTDKTTNSFRSKVLGFSVIATIVLLIITFSNFDTGNILYLIPVYLVLAWLIRFGLKPDKVITNLVITQMGGVKKYNAINNKDLQEFIDKINETLI